jgi:hypothetical protein
MQVEGQHSPEQSGLMATGARVSNAYATYPVLGDNPEKFGLISHEDIERHLLIFKVPTVRDGHA